MHSTREEGQPGYSINFTGEDNIQSNSVTGNMKDATDTG